MSEYTDTFMNCEVGRGAMIDPMIADTMAAASRLLTDIARCEPSLTNGPLRRDRQHWTRTGRCALSLDDSPARPRKANFIAPSASLNQKASVKPFGIGLYTSTATSAGCSSWRALFGPHGSMLYPLPWYTWELEVESDIKVAEIVSATTWVKFVCAHACTIDGMIYPDWVTIAREFDAVHVTLPAIIAAQGFHFDTPGGTIPPAFWDVETTFWLRWCFPDARLVEIVDAE
jgi:hypothetical protein